VTSRVVSIQPDSDSVVHLLDVTVRRGTEVIAEFRGRSHTPAVRPSPAAAP
jgi:hypothetical protein